jgi:PadR family transcriptional regulator, regulatory protein PadR
MGQVSMPARPFDRPAYCIYGLPVYSGVVMSMREPTYYTLAALLDGPLHGYAIIKRAAELSGGRVRLAAGTLYAALDRLTEAELVRVEREEIVNGRARRYYRLNDAGRRELEAEAARMAEASRVVTGRVPKRRPTPGARPE